MKRYCYGNHGNCQYYTGDKKGSGHTLRQPCPYRDLFKLNEKDTVSDEIKKERREEKERVRWELKQEGY